MVPLAMFPLTITITREHNELFDANKTTFRLGMNSFSDLTAEEFSAIYNGFRQRQPNSYGPRSPSPEVLSFVVSFYQWLLFLHYVATLVQIQHFNNISAFKFFCFHSLFHSGCDEYKILIQTNIWIYLYQKQYKLISKYFGIKNDTNEYPKIFV